MYSHWLSRVIIVAIGSIVVQVARAEEPEATTKPLNRFPRMVQEWLVAEVRALDAQNAKKYAAIASKGDGQSYIESVRQRISKCFGPLPDKTPLNARVTHVIDRGAYRIENIVFESRPMFLVTGNCYLPKGRAGPLPAVLGVCGHSANGKAIEAYQSFAQGLARLGYVVLIIDPVGQGERLQYLDGLGKSRYAIGTGEHIQMGNQQTLVGEFLGTWMAWDGIRGLDYLLSRPEVDPKHIGVTGNSGGGTQTTWLCGLESRWTMAAPACFVTSFRRNLENELPADTEQCPPRALALGLDHADFLAALAPKPTIILAQEKDYFDARGVEAAHARLAALYRYMEKPDATKMHIGSDYHGYSQGNREAMYRFFGEATGGSGIVAEPTLKIEEEKTLWAADDGQVGLMGSRTVASFTKEKSQLLARTRKPLSEDGLRQAISQVLRLPTDRRPLDFRILRSVGNRNYPMKSYCVYAVDTEPGIQALVTRLLSDQLMSRPPRGAKRAVLYVSHRSMDMELRTEPLIGSLIKSDPEAAFYACDLRGIGESQPNVCGTDQFTRPYGSDYFHAAHGLMLDRPTLGQRTFDLLRVIEWLGEQGHSEVHLAGRGWGAIPALFAGVLSDGVSQITLKNCLSSFAEVAETEDYRWPYAVMLPGVLEKFDLPDCRSAVKSKRLHEIEPWGAKDGMN